MNSKCYCTGWSLVAGLAASVLAMPSFASGLTLDEALRLAENNAPSLTAQDAKIQAASSAAIPAGELPDPKLLLGVQNYPIGGPDRWSIDQDFMTMRMVGVSQEMPNSAKRNASKSASACSGTSTNWKNSPPKPMNGKNSTPNTPAWPMPKPC